MTLGDSTDVAGVDPLAARVVRALTARGESVATAESLTGGLLAAALTSVPGASAVVRGGIVAYATDLKATLLGVPAELLARTGPVDPEVARAMAAGAAARCTATWGLATTGVAGPDPQGGVPVGTVYVAVGGAAAVVRRLVLDPGLDRAAIRAATVTAVLSELAVLLSA